MIEPRIDYVMKVRLKNLVAGAEAQQIHEQKVAKVVNLIHKCHIAATPGVAALLGSDTSNAKKLVDKLVAQKVLQECQVDFCSRAPRGVVYKLGPFGVLKAERLSEDFVEYRYDTGPRVSGLPQAEHDLLCSEIAAHWIYGGGELIDTDYTIRRSQTAEQPVKIVDLVLGHNDAFYSVEVEKSPKSEREADQMVLAALTSTWRFTAWVCIAGATANHLRRMLDQRHVNEWVLNGSNKWVKSGSSIPLPFEFRRRQLVIHLPKEALPRAPIEWQTRFQLSSDDMIAKARQRVRAKGWNVSRLKPSIWVPGSTEFELSQPTVSDLLLVCTHLGDGNWRLHLAEEPPESGQPVLARIRPAKDFEERPAPTGVVEAIVDSLDVINRGGQ